MPSTLPSFPRLRKFKLLTKFYRLSFFDVILFVVFFRYFFLFSSSLLLLVVYIVDPVFNFFSCFQVLRSRKVQCMLFLKMFQTESILVELKFYCKICCNFFRSVLIF